MPKGEEVAEVSPDVDGLREYKRINGGYKID
jgi:hypothetical protein